MSATMTSSKYHQQFSGMLVAGQTYSEDVFLVRANITADALNEMVSDGLHFRGGGNCPRYFAVDDYLEYLTRRETPAAG